CYMKRDGARATVVLLMGGGGGIGLKGGVPRSQNFLVRSREHFAASVTWDRGVPLSRPGSWQSAAFAKPFG
ncbi:MAG: hypothetical protein AABZ69_02320, partial [Candidatus Binatota bacterium]